MAFKRNQGGADGASHDFEEVMMTGRLEPTKIQGKPINMNCTINCDSCGTSDQGTGRPGSSMDSVTCRSCGVTFKVNGGMGFKFWSMN